ncbi:MAG: gliding motility lipoprotein GldD [Bacteroidota bacterium]|nr:gliding motility lipoprotein GldD [Bacteroidota bacterium]
MHKIIFSRRAFIVVLLLFSLSFTSCRHKYTPRPRGYFRISFPKKEYKLYDEGHPYRFMIPVYAQARLDDDRFSEPHWVNITIPANKADIHISYKEISPSEYYRFGKKQLSAEEAKRAVLMRLTEDSRDLAYKHSVKASAIEEKVFINSKDKVYGTVYLIKGNAASPMQFYLTDSTRHFLRGALYIREVPNSDSLQPVIKFLEKDIRKLIETTQWR